MSDKKKHSFFASFGFAIKGIKTALSERNFRLHLLSTTVVIVLGILLQVNVTEWLILLLCIGSVVSLELINTALEYFVDLVSPEFNEKAGKVKDIAAAAVLAASIIAFIVGLIIFIPYLY